MSAIYGYHNVPMDISTEIKKHLNPIDMRISQQVSKHWNKVFQQPTQQNQLSANKELGNAYRSLDSACIDNALTFISQKKPDTALKFVKLIEDPSCFNSFLKKIIDVYMEQGNVEEAKKTAALVKNDSFCSDSPELYLNYIEELAIRLASKAER